MRSLFISSNLLNSKNGGWQCSNRNLESITELSSYTETYSIEPFSNLNKSLFKYFDSVFNLFKFYSGSLNKQHIQKILLKIDEGAFDVVFVDSSVYGKLIKAIKTKFPGLRLVSFFHNIEFDFILNLVLTGGVYHAIRMPACFYNEYLTSKFSDKLICLTPEDEKLVNRYYTKREVFIIPVSFKKNNAPKTVLLNDDKIGISILFVGSYFYSNIHGIKWFINHVHFNDDVKLIIVGKNMNKLKENINLPGNVIIYDSVENLAEYYDKVNAVICPLFYGGGMKVKVAEALMFGKKIIGTNMAFQGYKAGLCKTMIQTQDAEVFKNEIDKLDPVKKFYGESEKHFCDFFSYDATIKLFREVLLFR